MKTQKIKRSSLSLNESDWQMWGIPLCSKGKDEVLDMVDNWLDLKQKNRWIATVNPEFVMKTTKDNSFLKILLKTDLNVIDGIGLIWAKALGEKPQFPISNFQLKRIILGLKMGIEILQGKHRQGLASGSDLVGEFCKLAAKKDYSVYFLGGFGDRAERSAKYFKSKFPISNFQLSWSEGEPGISNEEVINKINEFKPDFLFVAYGMKKQEEWIEKNIKKLNVGVVMGVGRSFDYYSGDLKRAPMVWRKMGMEWLYSLIQEPKRWRRQLELPKFVWKVLFSK